MSEIGDWRDTRQIIVATIQKAETLDDIGLSMTAIQDYLGFSHYKIYAASPDFSTPLGAQLLLHNYPNAFIDDFDALGIRVSPPAEFFDTSKALTTQWTAEQIVAELDPCQQEALRDLMRRHGIGRGVYFAMHVLDGTSRVLGFYGTRPELAEDELEELGLLGIQVIHRVRELERRESCSKVSISELEARCLELASAGLDSAEIARRLSLSVRTVLYLTNSLCRKLGVETLQQAVVAALKRGYIA